MGRFQYRHHAPSPVLMSARSHVSTLTLGAFSVDVRRHEIVETVEKIVDGGHFAEDDLEPESLLVSSSSVKKNSPL